jgi:hypothetical protein
MLALAALNGSSYGVEQLFQVGLRLEQQSLSFGSVGGEIGGEIGGRTGPIG